MKKIALFLILSLLSTQIFAKNKLTVVGTGDGIDLMRALSANFSVDDKNAEVTIPPSIGSGGGINLVGKGDAILGRVARKLKNEEISAGISYMPVARIPTVFFVHKGIKINSLTSQQLASIYEGKVRNWKELGGEDMKIRIVRREDGDSSLGALRSSLPLWKSLVITERTKTATSTQEAIDTVQDVQGAIGFGPYSTRLAQQVTVLTIDNANHYDANYPSAVELALIYRQESLNHDAKNFITFMKTPKAKELIMSFGAHPVVK